MTVRKLLSSVHVTEVEDTRNVAYTEVWWKNHLENVYLNDREGDGRIT
jgi:hypothetical protein